MIQWCPQNNIIVTKTLALLVSIHMYLTDIVTRN